MSAIYSDNFFMNFFVTYQQHHLLDWIRCLTPEQSCTLLLAIFYLVLFLLSQTPHRVFNCWVDFSNGSFIRNLCFTLTNCSSIHAFFAGTNPWSIMVTYIFLISKRNIKSSSNLLTLLRIRYIVVLNWYTTLFAYFIKSFCQLGSLQKKIVSIFSSLFFLLFFNS